MVKKNILGLLSTDTIRRNLIDSGFYVLLERKYVSWIMVINCLANAGQVVSPCVCCELGFFNIIIVFIMFLTYWCFIGVGRECSIS